MVFAPLSAAAWALFVSAGVSCTEEAVPSVSALSAAAPPPAVTALASAAIFLFPTRTVKTKGTAMAASMLTAKLPMYSGLMDRMPGMPPTPMALAVVCVDTQITAAAAEPIMPQTKGYTCFKFTPKIAGSVTPR